MYHVYKNQAAAPFCSFISSFFFLSNCQTLTIFVTLFSRTVRPGKLKLGTPHVDSGQMYRVHQIKLLLLIRLFISSFFFLSNFQTLNFFVTHFSGTVKPRRLKLGTHVDSGQMYRVYRNQAAAAYSSLISSIFFLSNFQTLNIFFSLFSETVRPIRLKLDPHVDNGWMYRVYRNQAAASYLSAISSVFSLSNVQKIQICVTFFPGTVRPKKLKLGTHVDNRCIYHVYRNKAAAAAYLFFFFFLSNFQLQICLSPLIAL